MKKRHLLCFAALLSCLVLSACGGQDASSGHQAAVANPMQKMSSLSEVNDTIGCAMKAPDGFSVSGEQFFVISGTIGEYRFTLDGISYTLRASAADGDISGVYVDGRALGDAISASSDSARVDTAIFEGGMWTRWFDGDMQYSLLSDETGAQDTSALYRVRDALR